MNALIKFLTLGALVVFASGCVHNNTVEFNWTQDTDHSVVLMPTDIQLSELTAGGLEVPNAEWTALAEKHFDKSLREKLLSVNVHIIEAQKGLDQPAEQITLAKLNNTVTGAIISHRPGAPGALPTKATKPVWTLGPKTQKLKERYGADYALFVHMRDSYTSGGRAAAIIVAAAFGVGIQGGSQRGFASLVDLNTGEVVWHHLLLRGKGNMRTPSGARETADALLSGLPG